MSATLAAEVNGARTTRVALHVPCYGAWRADVDFDSKLDDAALTGAAVLSVGDSELRGTFVTSATGSFQLQSRARIVGGAASMSTMLAARDYHSDAGVLTSTIVDDAIREAGETRGTSTLTSERVGVDFVRKAVRARDVLAQLGVPWYVTLDGRVNVGARTSANATAPHEVLDHDTRLGVVTLSADAIDAVLPGHVITARVNTPVLVRSVDAVIADGKIRVVARVGASLFEALGAAARAAIPELPYCVPRRYRLIELLADGRAHLQAVRAAAGLPDALYVSITPGAAGVWSQLQPGTIVVVQFVDGDAAQPIATHFEGREGAGFVPIETSLCTGASGTAPSEHATSAEALSSLVLLVATALGALVAPPKTPAEMLAIVAGAVQATATTPLDPALLTAISLALAAKSSTAPSIGWPGVRGA